jgi:hypothetical protein
MIKIYNTINLNIFYFIEKSGRLNYLFHAIGTSKMTNMNSKCAGKIIFNYRILSDLSLFP